MKYQTINILVLGLLLVQSCSVNRDNTPEKFEKEELAFIIQTMKDTISTTPYSALILHTSVDVVSVLDDNSVEKHIYHARVLETYRGQELENISYTMFVEKGETAFINKASFVVILCVNNEGFYWPGTGSSFPATEDILKAAKRISQNIKLTQQSFSYCE